MVYQVKNKNYSPFFFIKIKRYAIENQKDIKSLKQKEIKKGKKNKKIKRAMQRNPINCTIIVSNSFFYSN
jgi:hypothetical protein